MTTDDPHAALATLKSLMGARTEQMDAWTKAGQINVEFLERVNQVALHGAQTLVSRQSNALRSTFDEVDSLMRALTQNGNGTMDPDVQQRCVTTSIQCALEHVRVAMECAQEMNTATFDAMKERLEVFTQPGKPQANKKG
ncbi:MAG: phasin family protein [Geminicoccales bacterium]